LHDGIDSLGFSPMKLPLILTAVTIALAPMSNAESALEKGQAFLKENAKKEGVKTTSSGLQYKITKEGTGKNPKATDTVVVHYKGTTIDGKEFDSSFKRGEPATFPLNGVIKGWTEGLMYLSEGGKATLYIPSELAYGKRGAPGAIGPDETLIFDVELIRIK
jgi:FKBP-type peptidyl-prolyl cis-trans isomerase FkpA/FKBP-type peptidyl-prolyl cis-trans isomerase FklB